MKKIIIFLMIWTLLINFVIAADKCEWGNINSGVYLENPCINCASNNSHNKLFQIDSGVLLENVFFEKQSQRTNQIQTINKNSNVNVVKESASVINGKLNIKDRENLMKSEVWIQTTLKFRNDIAAQYGGTGEIIKLVKTDKTMIIYLLTAAHVVGNAIREIQDAKININVNGYAFPAEVMKKNDNYAVNWDYELILIKAEISREKELEDSMQALELSQKEVTWGMNVYIVGFPAKIPKASEGYISMLGNLGVPTVLSDGTVFFVKYLVGIETYGIVVGGISGGAVINEEGKLTAVIWGGFNGEPFVLATPIDASARKWISEWLK